MGSLSREIAENDEGFVQKIEYRQLDLHHEVRQVHSPRSGLVTIFPT